tara:strand:+ start:3022 stop:3483 length:462 start_codon:yes stop_codon:yes gene_type:complete
MKTLFFLLFLLTISCSNNKVVNNHGSTAIALKSNKIEISKSNKNDVLAILGKPSTISLFDQNSWFFIEREKVNQSIFKFGKSKISKNNVLELTFNNYGIVQSKKIYDLENMNDLKKVKETTQKKYDTNSKIGKLIKSLEQKINAPKMNRAKRK